MGFLGGLSQNCEHMKATGLRWRFVGDDGHACVLADGKKVYIEPQEDLIYDTPADLVSAMTASSWFDEPARLQSITNLVA